jgi:A/G-specific adenine glycosylase
VIKRVSQAAPTKRKGGARRPASSRKQVPSPRSVPNAFATILIDWQRHHGRNDLPWQKSTDPYRVWLSEIMLQQTQVATVIPYYERFLHRFPDLKSLAIADLDDVLRLWSGLGYYSRARNLHRAAKDIVDRFGGSFPNQRVDLETLSGVGRSTAAAIAVFSFGKREAILDGNVKRVLARHFEIAGHPAERLVHERLWTLAESLLPDSGIERYTQALMDIGATVCTRKPDCGRCPLQDSCLAHRSGRETEFPSPRPRKKNLLRTTRMLVLRHQGSVLLVQRPPVGIWAGLWSFPEVPEESTSTDYCRDAIGVSVARILEFPAIRHEFTHFSLDITPALGMVSGHRPLLRMDAARWVPVDEVSAWALPAPVRSLLGRMEAGELEQ